MAQTPISNGCLTGVIVASKPEKKSDAKKTKMRERQNRRFVFNPEYHLIVSEGKKTEPNYFRALAENVNGGVSFRSRDGRDFIRFHVEGSGKNTRDVFADAVKMARDIEARESVRISHVWVVYDKDDFPDERFNVVEGLCAKQSSDETLYHALWSNQCIELWFLLHFEFCNTAIGRDDYCRKLSVHLKAHGYAEEYEKNCMSMFEWLLPNLEDALRNSKRLFRSHPVGLTAAKKNPATVVFRLFDELLPHINR